MKNISLEFSLLLQNEVEEYNCSVLHRKRIVEELERAVV